MSILAVVIAFTVGFGLNTSDESSTLQEEKPLSSSDYPLLAQRIFTENPSDIKLNFSPLRSSLRQYFANNQLVGSLYYEYLPTGTSIRINANQEYRAASLMKLPAAMELFKADDLGLIDIDQQITIKEEWLNDGFGELYEKGAGYSLSLREAVRILLEESDNTAGRIVLSATDAVLPLEERALGSLDIEFTVDTEGVIDIGARSYGSFLKCLYFACYNSVENSQIILEYLTQTDFDQRIVAGVPTDTLVAHKIGVFNTNVQSDCGIVYKDRSNYVLCIMIQGDDSPETNRHFANLSKIVYEYTTN